MTNFEKIREVFGLPKEMRPISYFMCESFDCENVAECGKCPLLIRGYGSIRWNDEYKELETTRWVPVRERLPENNMSVLITVRRYNGEVVVRSGYYYTRGDISFFHADNGNCWNIDEKELLAWQPLLEPYEPQESEVK